MSISISLFTKSVEQTVLGSLHVGWTMLRLLSFSFLILFYLDKLVTSKKIKHLKMVYTPFPIFNGLEVIVPQIKDWKDSPCLQFFEFSKYYGEVYQINFGTRLVVVANSYDSIKALWGSKNVKGNNSRPLGYSFHKVLSKGIYTIGTTPAGESYKNARKNINETVLCDKRNNDFNYVIINQSCNAMIQRITSASDMLPLVSDDLLKEAQYFHLTIALWLTYGFEFNPEDPIHKNLADQIIVVENKITKVRSHVQNSIDYLPGPLRFVLGLFSDRNRELQELYNVREGYLRMFYEYAKKLHEDIKSGELLTRHDDYEKTINKIEDMKKSLMYNYFEDTNTRLTTGEITSECLTMVSAGLDNTPLNFKYGIHQLVNYHPEMWHTAYSELVEAYDGDVKRAYNECGSDMRCEYIKAIVQETLRLFTVLPMALPRETTSNVIYQNVVIPKGTTLFMNCWAGNHDERKFPDPMTFRPERWLTTVVTESFQEKTVVDTTMRHFAFGIGCRMCLGNNFAIRELYVLFCKLILKFEPVPATGLVPTDNPLALNSYPESLAIEPVPFNIVLRLREHAGNGTPA